MSDEITRMRAWLDTLSPERRKWAILCMRSAAEDGVAGLRIDQPSYSALLHARLATIPDLKKWLAEGHDLETLDRIGPGRAARIKRALEGASV